MATSQAASAATAAAVVGGTSTGIGETIVGSHLWKIDGFSATKDLGVGKSITSSEFSVGGHRWCIQCYPCGVDEDSAGWVSLFLCLSDHKERVEAGFQLILMGDYGNSSVADQQDIKHTFNADTLWRSGDSRTVEREDLYLESLLKDDCLQIRCGVSIVRVFPAVPPPDLHRPLISHLLASGMPGHGTTFQVGEELFTLHRGLPGSSAHLAASTTSAGASSSTAARISAGIDKKVVGSHVLTIDGYSRTKKVCCPGGHVRSDYFDVAGHRLSMGFCPSAQVPDENFLSVFLEYFEGEDVLKVRFEFTLLTLAREIISSVQSCYAFTISNDYICRCYFPFNMETEPLLGDSFHAKCDVTVVNEITPLRPPELHLHLGDLVASQVGADVEFEVGSDLLISAHKCVLATRSTAFMAEFFGPRNSNITTATATATRVRIDDMEPRVFKALLHFIYTDSLPEILADDDDKVVMAQGLLVAADRYAMERLKFMCADMLCSYVNDPRKAVVTLDLADKHGCRRLKEVCMKLLKDHHLADVVAP